MEKNNLPLVSIVIITYNSERYILDTLESVKNQTWNNLELIISDDCSHDRTIDICSEWINENSKRFRNVQLITVQQNTGIPANCNRGLRATNGEYLKIISGDDILLKECISDNMSFIKEREDRFFVISDLREIDEEGKIIRDKLFNDKVLFFDNISTVKKQLKAYTRWPAFLNTPSFFIKREVIEKVGYCDENYKIYEDMTMVIRALEKGYRLNYMHKTTVAYRIHSESISRKTDVDNIRKQEAIRVFREYRRKHLSIFNIFDLSVFYDSWLRLRYRGRGVMLLRKLSFYYWYMRFSNVKTY